jgi:hypothetical protein
MIFSVPLFAQEEEENQNICTQVLKNAQKLYDEGKLSPIPSMLNPCIEQGFTRAEKLSALRLLILTYLFQDEHDLAEQTLLVLLKEDPDYRINEALDPAEFIYLYNSYRTLPVISIGVIGGVNQTRVSLKQEYSTDNINSSEVSYKPGINIQFGLTADFLIYKNLQANFSVLFSGRKYEMTSGRMFNYTNLHVKETQSWLEAPLTLKYIFGNMRMKKFLPFIQAGISGNVFLSSRGEFSRISIENDNDASGPSVKLNDLRKKFNSSAILGGGARYKIGYGYVVLDIRYHLGLGNVVNVENRYSNSELIYYYGYIDNDFKLNNVSISFGYLKSFYKPKKIKVKNE